MDAVTDGRTVAGRIPEKRDTFIHDAHRVSITRAIRRLDRFIEHAYDRRLIGTEAELVRKLVRVIRPREGCA